MNENNHIIQKQFVKLKVPRRENCLALQQQFERMLQEELVPRLEPVFDRLCGPDEWVEFDKLQVNLGRLDPYQKHQWLERTYVEVTKAINIAAKKTRLHQFAKPSAQQDVLLFFLQHGYLPWCVVKFNLEDVHKLIASAPKKLLSWLSEQLARKRWVRQFGPEIQKSLLNALTLSPPFSYVEWKELAAAYFTSAGSVHLPTERILQELYWETVWEALQQPAETQTGLTGDVPGEPWLRPADLKKWIPQSESARSFISGGQSISPNRKEKKTSHPSQNPVTGEGIYVLLAGIVLIHPFLPAFFEKTGLLEAEQFKNEAARERAVHLLYFLATGTEHPGETETVVLKLLCGMEIEMPIAKELYLEEKEKAEAIHLMESTIHYWKELQGSTQDELRGTFFMREGKLTPRELGWYLKVEEKTYDILLSKLPWGISPIMHTWMPQMLWVGWV